MNTKPNLQIPSDIGEHCQTAATALLQHKAMLDGLWELWADEDPDPENGFYWTLHIEHPDADRMRRNMMQIAHFLEWLAQHGQHEQEVGRVE